MLRRKRFLLSHFEATSVAEPSIPRDVRPTKEEYQETEALPANGQRSCRPPAVAVEHGRAYGGSDNLTNEDLHGQEYACENLNMAQKRQFLVRDVRK